MYKLNQPGSTGRYGKACLVVLMLAFVLLSSACANRILGIRESEQGAIDKDEMIRFINEYSELKAFYDSKNNANSTSAGPPAGCDFYFARKSAWWLFEKKINYVLMNEKFEVVSKFFITGTGAKAFSLPDKDCGEIFYLARNGNLKLISLLRIEKTGRDLFTERIVSQPDDLHGHNELNIFRTSPGGKLTISNLTYGRNVFPCKGEKFSASITPLRTCNPEDVERVVRRLLALPEMQRRLSKFNDD